MLGSVPFALAKPCSCCMHSPLLSNTSCLIFAISSICESSCRERSSISCSNLSFISFLRVAKESPSSLILWSMSSAHCCVALALVSASSIRSPWASASSCVGCQSFFCSPSLLRKSSFIFLFLSLMVLLFFVPSWSSSWFWCCLVASRGGRGCLGSFVQ